MSTSIVCRDEQRRQRIRETRKLNGIDYVDVQGTRLCVHFLVGIPEEITARNVVIKGGRRITGIVATNVEKHAAETKYEESCLRIEVDREGDWSTYTLCFVEVDKKTHQSTSRPLHSLDSRYACIDFTFKLDCNAEIDCKSGDPCPQPVRERPAISYLAKDYASFRQLILDRLALIMPDWRERHVPDVGITLVELLAYVGDYLSYYQDAVATEQYLETARRRISVRRHARLVDYAMHEGCNARAFLDVQVNADFELDIRNTYFTTRDSLIFEPVALRESIPLRIAHNTIAIYTWGNQECCLPKGSTHATLLDEALQLEAGDLLLFEELACAGTVTHDFDGKTPRPDADKTHRHVVRLTSVTRAVDRLLEKRVLEVEWSREDALPFALCVSAIGGAPDCDYVEGLAVARGNVVLVDHGRTIRDEPLPPVAAQPFADVCEGEDDEAEVPRVAARYRPRLAGAPLTFAEPIGANAPASSLARQNPRAALPQITVSSNAGPWSPRADLLDSGDDDAHFVAEIDDDGFANLRFGDGDAGRALDPGMSLAATYRTGNGRAGVVGPETIVNVVLRRGIDTSITSVRNPLPSSGAVDPEPVEEVKMFAPNSFRDSPLRAITAGDYAMLAQYLRFPDRNPRVQSAAAQLQWTGSWLEANVAVDAFGSSDLDPSIRTSINEQLHRYRRMGHDLRVGAASSVPLRLVLDLCIKPHYLRAHVVVAVRDALRRFFNPDNLTFGQPVAVSRIVAAVMSVEGIAEVHVVRLARLAHDQKLNPNRDFPDGLLRLGPSEVARLDNDPAIPENGILEFRHVRGGR